MNARPHPNAPVIVAMRNADDMVYRPYDASVFPGGAFASPRPDGGTEGGQVVAFAAGIR